MSILQSVFRWLETNWVVPAYPGWVLSGLVVFFFGAATNTMAGWLYVMSGVILALLAIAAALPPRSLKSLAVERSPIPQTMAGRDLDIRVTVHNQSNQPRELLELTDALPVAQHRQAHTVVEHLTPNGSFEWRYDLSDIPRGVYQWSTIQLRTAAPLGLFWCKRHRYAPAKAVVYPTILSLDRCPLLDMLGQESCAQPVSHHHAHQSNEGLTRALRPYRWGDPTRFIHWRTSARYGELRVRELEVLASSPSMVIAIDTAIDWQPQSFEQAAIAAISLYDYATRQNITASLWTAHHGHLHSKSAIYEALAAIAPHQGSPEDAPKAASMIWLTQFPSRLNQVSRTSSWLLWMPPPPISPSSTSNSLNMINHSGGHSPQAGSVSNQNGYCIDPQQDLKTQLSTASALFLP
jgi:uncharacterized protein (DUF58 family)